MKELQSHLEGVKPGTMLLAREMLGIAVTILAYAHEDAESPLAAGPVLELIQNVVAQLEYCDGAMKLGPKPKHRPGESLR
jgi:hypothetical protein